MTANSVLNFDHENTFGDNNSDITSIDRSECQKVNAKITETNIRCYSCSLCHQQTHIAQSKFRNTKSWLIILLSLPSRRRGRRQHDALYSFSRCWSQCIRLLLFYSVIFSPPFSSPSFSSLANSTPATLSVIFHSCKFQSCKFSYPEVFE